MPTQHLWDLVLAGGFGEVLRTGRNLLVGWSVGWTAPQVTTIHLMQLWGFKCTNTLGSADYACLLTVPAV